MYNIKKYHSLFDKCLFTYKGTHGVDYQELQIRENYSHSSFEVRITDGVKIVKYFPAIKTKDLKQLIKEFNGGVKWVMN